MARLRIVDVEIPDGQVEAVLTRFFPGQPVAIIETERALPAPVVTDSEPTAQPAPPIPAPAPRVVRESKPPQTVVKQAAKGKSAPGDGLAARIPAVLPGTAREIATRLGASYAGVNWAIRAMRRRRQIVGDGKRGCIWTLPQTSAMPATAAKPGDLKTFLLAELGKGPRDSGELMMAARQAGIECPDRFAVAKILDSSNEVLGGHGSRWTLAHRAGAGE